MVKIGRYLPIVILTKTITISVPLLMLLIGLSTLAGTPQDWGKWKEGELLLENHSFEDDLAAWDLEDGACCNRGGLYTMEIDKKNPQHGKQSLKVIGHKATGTAWQAKVKQRDLSMKSGKTYTVVFWARSEKPREVQLSVQRQSDPWTFYQGGTINLLGPEWMEYHITFQSKADVQRDMWVGLSIAQSDVDFWIDNFRYFEGEPEDDLNRDTPFPVNVKGKLATQWPGVGFTFSATETNLLAGDTFTLNLNAENITDLAGWQANITFDPNILEAVEVIEGDFLKAQGGDTFFQDGTIDNTTGKITDLFSARIAESGVSGTGPLLSVTLKAKAGGETQVTMENFEFGSITGDIIPTVPPNITITIGDYPAWDVNQDGRVSVLDLILVATDLGAGTPANLQTDVNQDGIINIQDLLLVAQHLGESTDAAAPSVITAINNGELTPTMIQTWITQAQIENEGSLAFRQGIATLERILTLFIPEETALLHNYPNPFNPETWIPYQLAEPAEVTLTIHAVNGTLVRTLVLGYQPAGIYHTRTRAAYWDGKNEVGESVASGVYFYTLSTESTRDSVTAGDFNATRKMLIRK